MIEMVRRPRGTGLFFIVRKLVLKRQGQLDKWTGVLDAEPCTGECSGYKSQLAAAVERRRFLGHTVDAREPAHLRHGGVGPARNRHHAAAPYAQGAGHRLKLELVHNAASEGCCVVWPIGQNRFSAIVFGNACSDCTRRRKATALVRLLAHFENAVGTHAQYHGRMAAHQDHDNRGANTGLPRDQVVKRAVQCGSERQPRAQRRWQNTRGLKGAKLPHRDTSQDSKLRLPERGRAMKLSKGAQAQRERLRGRIPHRRSGWHVRLQKLTFDRY